MVIGGEGMERFGCVFFGELIGGCYDVVCVRIGGLEDGVVDLEVWLGIFGEGGVVGDDDVGVEVVYWYWWFVVFDEVVVEVGE